MVSMPRLALRYLGHRAGASLSYFTGASMDLVPGSVFEVPAGGLVIGRRATAALARRGNLVEMALSHDDDEHCPPCRKGRPSR
jgi:hypothetical protein